MLWLYKQSRLGMHTPAFRKARLLRRQGPAAAQAYYRELGRMLAVTGLLDDGAADETSAGRRAA